MRLLLIGLPSLLFAALIVVGAQGQTTYNWTNSGTGNWTSTGNWDSGGLLPTGTEDEIGNIDNGGTAVVDSDLSAITPPDGPPGGLTVTNDSKLDVIGSGAFLTEVDMNLTADGSVLFSSGGTLALTGGSASFDSHSLSFAGGGIYEPVLTGASHGLISVAGNLNLNGGILRPAISLSPSPTNSWVLADAASISGDFDSDFSSLPAGSGRKFSTSIVGGGANGLQYLLELNDVLVLTVDTDSGGASISTPTGTSITMTGYGISSATGGLNPAGWMPLATSLGGGWEVATSSVTQLDELGGPVPPGNTTNDSLTLSGAATQALGSPFNSNLPFGTPAADVGFEYVTSTGNVVEGEVVFTGLSAVNNLLLSVDPISGEARLQNSSPTTINLHGYSISSDSGSLKPSNGDWNSLEDQLVPGIEEANPSPTSLSELVPLVANTLELTAGQSYLLGDLFNASGTADLELEFHYSLTSTSEGDFNGDGEVNGADLPVWEAGYGTIYDGADFLAWQRNLGMTSGPGAPITASGAVVYEAVTPLLAAVAVPEPMTFSLAILVGAIVVTRRRRSEGPLKVNQLS